MDQKNQRFFKRKPNDNWKIQMKMYIFLSLTPKAETTKEKIGEFDYIIFSLLYTEIFTDEMR